MVKLKKNIWYVGVQNPGLRVFDIIMATKYGTSYNSYLIKGEQYALVEAAHSDYTEEFIENIEEIVPVSQISYIILNHTEPDHSGNLVKLLEMNPNLQVIGTTAAIRNLKAITNADFTSRTVKDGEQLDLGDGMVLEFIIAPNLHWPDSMFTYCAKEKVLFSCDVFGAHYCEPMVLDKHIKYPEAFVGEQKNYYDCIFGPFKSFVLSGLKKLEGRDIEMVCNSHGPVLEEQVQATIERYKEWSKEEARGKDAAIFYVSAYGYTEMMAKALAEGLKEAGVDAKLFNIIEHDPAQLAEVMNHAGAVLFGSSTINRAAVPPVLGLISMTEAINVKNKPAMVFGSYGWTGEACRQLTDLLAGYKYKVYGDGVQVVFKPTAADLESIQAEGRKFGETFC